MKTTLTKYDFENNQTLKDNYTYEAIQVLWNYFEHLEEDTGIEEDFDPIEIIGTWDEVKNFEEFQESYPHIEKEEDINDYTIYVASESFYCSDNLEMRNHFLYNKF